MLHGFDGVSHVHRSVASNSGSPRIPEALSDHERPQVGVPKFGNEFTACEGIPGKVDLGARPFKPNSAPSVRIRCPIRNAKPLVQQERETLVNSGVELRNPTFGHYGFRLSAFMVPGQPRPGMKKRARARLPNNYFDLVALLPIIVVSEQLLGESKMVVELPGSRPPGPKSRTAAFFRLSTDFVLSASASRYRNQTRRSSG